MKNNKTINRKKIQSIIHSKSILEGITYDEAAHILKSEVIDWVFNLTEFKDKIAGMCFRNSISFGSKIEEDVFQECMLHLWRFNTEELLDMFYDDKRRVLGLSITIATRAGFAKLNNGESPNQSLVKKILWTSNFRGFSEDDKPIPDLESRADEEAAFDVWEVIKPQLTEDELEFLNFILENVYSKKRVYYGRTLRKVMSYNEYRLNFLHLKKRIEDIIDKNKIKGYGSK